MTDKIRYYAYTDTMTGECLRVLKSVNPVLGSDKVSVREVSEEEAKRIEDNISRNERNLAGVLG